MDPLAVVCFKWRSAPNYRSKFEAVHVNTLKRMVERHYPDPFRFICITDDPRGIDPDVEVYALWQDLAHVRSPHGPKNPSCYRRLRMFARNNAAWLGPRWVWVDLDCVIVGDMRPLWNRPEDFVIWKSTTSGNCYCGSMVLNRTGTRPQLWEDFDPLRSPIETRQARLFGSDQAWIAHRLGPREATWGPSQGAYSYRIQIKPNRDRLPDNARIIFHHGKEDPWSPYCARIPWVRQHYLDLMPSAVQKQVA